MSENPLRSGLGISREPDPFTLVIFGASGDLTRRKLIPALYALFTGGYLINFRIVGFARRKWSDADFRTQVAEMIAAGAESGADMEAAFLERIFYVSSSFADDAGYREVAARHRVNANMLYYLATPPTAYEEIIRGLGKAGLAAPPGADALAGEKQGFARLIIEKPFGADLTSAQNLNRSLDAVFREEQIYRIDHYLGKETVQNLLVFRFGNGVFEPVWNNRYVDHLQITMAETVGVGTRGAYYEQAGALRDIVQNHLLQLLCLAAMEPPNDLAPDSIRNEKLKVLKAVQPVPPERILTDTVRGQYLRGIIAGEKVPGYREEPGVSPDSRTETYVGLKLAIDNWRWAGVPFYLRAGKRLARRLTEIVVQFKHPPHLLFEGLRSAFSLPNQLVVRIQPDEGVMLSVNAKIPGFSSDMRPVHMDFAYGAHFGAESPEAYERLLLDAMLGDSTLYTRWDETETAWRLMEGVLDGWAEQKQLSFYPAGSSGPEEARKLFERIDRRWRKL
jgi:glucose-6-phosphate 1-dehydrogenase